MGRGQYESLGEYCAPDTAFSVFVIIGDSLCENQPYSPIE